MLQKVRFSSVLSKPQRFFSVAATEPVVEKSKKEPTLVGQYLASIQLKGKKLAPVPLRDLRTLYKMVEKPKDVLYAVLGSKYYQVRGEDFDEETNSHFIKACIRGGNPKAAADYFSIYKNRLSAWTSPKSLGHLVSNLNEIDSIVTMMDVLSKKGIFASKSTFVDVFQRFPEMGYENHIKLLSSAKVLLSPEHATEILSAYPAPTLAPTSSPSEPEIQDSSEEK